MDADQACEHLDDPERCAFCRNRTGIANAVVDDRGRVYCRRCSTLLSPPRFPNKSARAEMKVEV